MKLLVNVEYTDKDENGEEVVKKVKGLFLNALSYKEAEEQTKLGVCGGDHRVKSFRIVPPEHVGQHVNLDFDKGDFCINLDGKVNAKK